MPWIARRIYKPTDQLGVFPPERSQSLISLCPTQSHSGLDVRSLSTRELSASTGDIRSPPPAYSMQVPGQPGLYPRLDTNSIARAQRGEPAGPPSYTMATRGSGNLQHSHSGPLHPETGMPLQNGSVGITTVPVVQHGFSVHQPRNASSTPNLHNGFSVGQNLQIQNGSTTGITIPIIMHAPQPMVQLPQPVAAPVPSGPAPARPPPPTAEALSVPGAPPRYSVATAAPASIESNKKVSYVDFVPQLQKKHTFKPDKYEPFSVLLERANEWLENHGDATLTSCETLTWSGLKVDEIFSDNTTAVKSFEGSMNSKKNKTYYLRGLRMWYAAPEVPSSNPNHTALYSETFLPRDENTKLRDLLEEVNAKRFPGGRVISAECMCTPVAESLYDAPSKIDPDLSYWSESPSDEKKVVIAIRIFIDMSAEGPSEKIALKSFVPKKEPNVTNNNMGYEIYPEVFRKAARWITQQVDIRPCTIQNTPMKIKKKGDFGERTVFTEHGSSSQKFSNSDTNYLAVVRVFYLKQQIPFRSDIPRAPAPRLTLRTFLPKKTLSYPLKCEEMRKVVGRLNQWQKETGAKVHAVETIRMRGLGPESNMSEAATQTYSTNSAKNYMDADDPWPDNLNKETWVYAVRVFLSGDYSEPASGLSLTNPDRAAPTTRAQTSLSPSLSMRTFLPHQLSTNPAHYDTLVNVVNRLNQWLRTTGASLYGLETGYCRIQPDTHMNDSINATYSVRSPDRCFRIGEEEQTLVESPLYFIRAFFSGPIEDKVNSIRLVDPNNHDLQQYIMENLRQATDNVQPVSSSGQGPGTTPVADTKPQASATTQIPRGPSGPIIKSRGNIRNGVHVIHIAIDGLHPSSIAKAGANEMLHRLAASGMSTLANAKSSAHAASASGWAETLTGIPAAESGIISDEWTALKSKKKSSSPWKRRGHDNDRSPPLPTIFHALKSQKKNTATAAFYDWDWLRTLMQENDLGSMDVECYIDPLGRWSAADATLVDEAINFLGHALPIKQRSYTFIYLGNVKDMGQKLGFMGEQYLDAVREADRQVGRVLDAIEEVGNDKTFVILSSHDVFRGGLTQGSDSQVPLFIKGPGIRAGGQFQNQVHNLDIAPTVASILKIAKSTLWRGQEMAEAYEW